MLNSNASKPLSSGVPVILVMAGFWMVIALLISIQSYYSWNREGYDVTWSQAVILETVRWGLWMPISFLIIGLTKRLPIRKGRWKSRLFLHFLISAGVCLLHFGADTKVQLIAAPWPLASQSFFELYLSRLGSIRIHLSFALYWAILGMAHALQYYRKYHEGELRTSNLEAQLAQAQLQALKMQLHPHFLFNTLNSIASLVRNNRNKEATDMLAGLSDLLRFILENAGAQEVSLKQELDFLKRYLDIEQIRFEDRLQVEFAVPAKTLDARVPNLILQPLVENAILHGVLDNPEHSIIAISSRVNNGALEIEVRNSGPDLPGRVFDQEEGVGLSNTRARLQKLYGRGQSLEILQAHGHGTRVSLHIPYRRSQQDHDN